MSMKHRLRAAVKSDVPLILELIRALAEFEKLQHEVVATEFALEAQLFGAKPSAEVLICELSDDETGKQNETASAWTGAGFALFFTSFSTFLAKPGIYLEDLFIKPEFRSHGLGQKMLQALAQIALERDCGRLEWSVLDWNVRARKFYEDLGAKPMEEWTVHRVTGPALKTLAQN